MHQLTEKPDLWDFFGHSEMKQTNDSNIQNQADLFLETCITIWTTVETLKVKGTNIFSNVF